MMIFRVPRGGDRVAAVYLSILFVAVGLVVGVPYAIIEYYFV